MVKSVKRKGEVQKVILKSLDFLLTVVQLLLKLWLAILNKIVMNLHPPLLIAVSVVLMLVGFGLLFLVSQWKATDRHEFNLLRMLGLLCGCLLAPMPIIAAAWILRDTEGYLSAFLVLLAIIIGLYSPRIVLFMIKIIRGDAKQFLK